MDSTTLRKVRKNSRGRDFVIGDLHGCYDLLMEKLKEVSFNEQIDRLFSVGDLIDRGPDSEKCLNLIYEFWFYSVKGNHEDMMIRSVLESDMGSFQCWMANGGLWAIDKVKNQTEWDDELVDLVTDAKSHLPLAYEIDTDKGPVGIIHAQPPNEWSLENIKRGELAALWSRDLWSSGEGIEVSGLNHIYVGHTPVEEGPITRGNITYTDTGCNWTNKLTMIQIN